MFDLIANENLRESDVPERDAAFMDIAVFALTFDGYDRWGSECGDIANRWLAAYNESRALPESLTELRTCLFFEQRRWHHFGDTPGEQAMEYLYALLEAIRGRVAAGKLE